MENDIQTAGADPARRHALYLGAAGALLALVPGFGQAAVKVVETGMEPLHHVILQNEFMRVMRVLIRPGQATEFHEQHLDYVNTIVQGGMSKIGILGGGAPADVDMPSHTIRFGRHSTKPITDQVTNVGQTLIEQVAFEILNTQAGHFGPADRTGASSWTLVLDEPSVRGWRTTLEPGANTERYAQSGPGLRVILSGQRLIDTPPNGIGAETQVCAGYAMLTGNGSRILSNAGDAPLELFEYELR